MPKKQVIYIHGNRFGEPVLINRRVYQPKSLIVRSLYKNTPLLLEIDDAAHYMGVGRSTLKRWVAKDFDDHEVIMGRINRHKGGNGIILTATQIKQLSQKHLT